MICGSAVRLVADGAWSRKTYKASDAAEVSPSAVPEAFATLASSSRSAAERASLRHIPPWAMLGLSGRLAHIQAVLGKAEAEYNGTKTRQLEVYRSRPDGKDPFDGSLPDVPFKGLN